MMSRRAELALLLALLAAAPLGCVKITDANGNSSTRPTSSRASSRATTRATGGGTPTKVRQIPTDEEFSYADYTRLLKRYVDSEGSVDYKAWKASDEDLEALDDFIAAAANVDSKALNKDERVAFLINLYNAETLRKMLGYYPTKSILDHSTKDPNTGVWGEPSIALDGQKVSLNHIEKTILLKEIGEPRIHFAVVCASIGCPPLFNEAWTADRLDALYAQQAKKFFATPSKFRYDAETNTAYVSKLFDWYKGDFGGTNEAPGKVQVALSEYVSDPAARKAMAAGSATVDYLEYDWGINQQTTSAPPPEKPAVAALDHGPFDALLKRYVDSEGSVDYKAWKASDEDLEALDDYIAAAADLNSTALSKDERVAFLINLYNAETLRKMLGYYPTKSILEHSTKDPNTGVWGEPSIALDGQKVSLNHIEKTILLKEIGEPRIHFAVVCASIGCPPLFNEAWTADRLDALYAQQAKKFFATPSKFRYDAETNTAYVSKLFDWYKGDFGGTNEAPGKVQVALSEYVSDPAARKAMAAGSATVDYLEYDWGINEQK